MSYLIHFPLQASKEILTNSLIALKTKPAEEPAVFVEGGAQDKQSRQKRSVSFLFNQVLQGVYFKLIKHIKYEV